MADTAKSKPHRIADLLQPGDSGFARLLAVARQIDRLDRRVRSKLDPRLAEHVRVATVRGRELVLVTPVAAIATRLRLDGPELVAALRREGLDDIDTVRVRVAPFGPSWQGGRRQRRLSPAARDALKCYARSAGDEQLEDRLERDKDD